MTKSKTNIKPLLKIISNQFGPKAEAAFEDLYKGKPSKSAIVSAYELLHEVLGPRKAKELMKPICSKAKIDINKLNVQT